MKNKWVIYSRLFPHGIGLLIEDIDCGSYEIQYSEGQMYSNEIWDKKYCKRFSTLREAIKYWVEHSDDNFDEVLKLAKQNFPIASKELENK